MLRVLRVQGLASIQDLGRPGYRAAGVPPGGAMDQDTLRIANLRCGNPVTTAAVELGAGDLSLSTDAPALVGIGGLGPIDVDGTPADPATGVRLEPGQVLRLRPTDQSRFRYVAVAGGIDVPSTLGSRSTSLTSGWGGFEGRRLETGDLLPIGTPETGARPHSVADRPADPGPIRITAGPQAHLFPASSAELLAGEAWDILPSSDRMGTRLGGPALAIRRTAALPSESTSVGAIQVPDDGQPIVLLRDGPTVGGYPKIAAVIAADLDRFCQRSPGESVRFAWVSTGAALALLRAAHAASLARSNSIMDQPGP